MRREFNLRKNLWFSWGYGPRLAIGFSIDKYNISLDLLFVWVTLEY